MVGRVLAQNEAQFLTRYLVLYLGWTLDFMPRSWPTEPPQGQGP